MVAFSNPALSAFVAQIGDGLEFGQVAIGLIARGFDLRHAADSGRPVTQLEDVPVAALRQLAQKTAEGAFRPNKTAPTLRAGWRSVVRDAAELEEALRHLYPGGLADWYAARQPDFQVTTFREFAGRQTGRYARAQVLTDAAVAEVTCSCCAPTRCVRLRLWTVEGGPPDGAAAKSAIPCFEPCALLLDAVLEVAISGKPAVDGAR